MYACAIEMRRASVAQTRALGDEIVEAVLLAPGKTAFDIRREKMVGAELACQTDLDRYACFFVACLIEARQAARKAKDFAKADAIRAELLEKGIVLEDTREGVKWKRA